MRLEVLEAIMDSHQRLWQAVDRLARSQIEATMADSDFKVFKTYASLSAFYLDDNGVMTVDYTYSHPYEGEETALIDPNEIEVF